MAADRFCRLWVGALCKKALGLQGCCKVLWEYFSDGPGGLAESSDSLLDQHCGDASSGQPTQSLAEGH
jgi:hypothetical protein